MLFINFDRSTQRISINTYRRIDGKSNDSVVGLVSDIIANRSGCCPLEGALDAIENESLWAADDDVQEALDELLIAICLFYSQF